MNVMLAGLKPDQTLFFTRWRLACLAITILSGLIYLPVMSGLMIWDDHALIGGKGIGGGNSLSACFTVPFLNHYFRPLVSVSFFLDHKLWGTGTFFYHQTNLLIHVLTTAILLALLQTAFGNRRAALAGGLAFAVQPTQVSTVAWIGGRTDSLCTLFIALFLWMLIRAAQSKTGNRAGWITASVLAFLAALLTKEQVLSALPLAPLAFYCFSPKEERPTWRTLVKYTLPFAGAGLAFIIAWCLFYPQPFQPVLHSVSEQIGIAGRSFTYYTLLLFCPAPQWMHQLSLGPLERAGTGTAWLGFGILACSLVLFFRWLRSAPGLAFWLGFVLLTMLPISNLIPLPSLVVAPYRVGVTGLGVAALLGWAMLSPFQQAANRQSLWQTWIRKFHLRETRLALGSVFLLWCAGLTLWGTLQWENEHTIFSTFVRYDPDSIVARFNLTSTLIKQHKPKPAIAQLETMLTQLYGSNAWQQESTALSALQTSPNILIRVRENQGNSIRPEAWLAALYGQLGFARLNSEDRVGAMSAFLVGSRIDATCEEVNLGLAQLAYDAKNYRKAEGLLRLTLAARPTRAEAHMLLAHAYVAQERWKEARREFQAWAELQPWIGQAYMELADTDTRLGNYASARSALEYALHHSICNTREVEARLADLQSKHGLAL